MPRPRYATPLSLRLVANGLAADATHTVVVTVSGASNTASSGSRVDHDAMVYLR
jgi:hypothetical protein